MANLADGLVQLFDDGSNGDVTAGDRVYSRLVTASGALTHDGGTHQQLDAELFFEGLLTGVRINVMAGSRSWTPPSAEGSRRRLWERG